MGCSRDGRGGRSRLPRRVDVKQVAQQDGAAGCPVRPSRSDIGCACRTAAVLCEKKPLAQTHLAQLDEPSDRTNDDAPSLRLGGRAGRKLVHHLHEFAKAVLHDVGYRDRELLAPPALLDETRHGVSDVGECSLKVDVPTFVGDHEPLAPHPAGAHGIRGIRVRDSPLHAGGVSHDEESRDRVLHAELILDDAPTLGVDREPLAPAPADAHGIDSRDNPLHTDGVSHDDRARLLHALHSADAHVAHPCPAGSHGGDPSLAQAYDVAPPSGLILYTWNVEGKHDLVDVGSDPWTFYVCKKLEIVSTQQVTSSSDGRPSIARLQLW